MYSPTSSLLSLPRVVSADPHSLPLPSRTKQNPSSSSLPDNPSSSSSPPSPPHYTLTPNLSRLRRSKPVQNDTVHVRRPQQTIGRKPSCRGSNITGVSVGLQGVMGGYYGGGRGYGGVGKPVLAVRGGGRETGLAWFGRKVYSMGRGEVGVWEGGGEEARVGNGKRGGREERVCKGPGPVVGGKRVGVFKEVPLPVERKRQMAVKRRAVHKWRQDEEGRYVRKETREEDGSPKESGMFFVKATCRYGWENSTRCIFMCYESGLAVLKVSLAEAFGMNKPFDICYTDDDGDVVRVSSEKEMDPFIEVVRKQGGKVRIKMVAPYRLGVCNL